MAEVQESLVASFYALFAFEQNLRLDELAVGAQSREFPAAATHTPDWFAAAADSVDILAMAPELRVMSADETDDESVVDELDIISVYAPEMAAQRRERAEAAQARAAGVETASDATVEPVNRGPSSFELLRELSGLDD